MTLSEKVTGWQRADAFDRKVMTSLLGEIRCHHNRYESAFLPSGRLRPDAFNQTFSD